MKVTIYKSRHIAEADGEYRVFVDAPSSNDDLKNLDSAATYPSLNEARAFIDGYTYSFQQSFDIMDAEVS